MADRPDPAEYRGTLDIQEQIARIDKLIAEKEKLTTETKWYHMVIISGATLAIVAVAKLFL